MKKLLRYLKNYIKESIIGPLFKMLEASFELFVPIVMAQMIDVGIVRGDTGYIWQMGAILVGLGVLGLVCSLTAQYFAAKASVGMGTALRHDLFAHIGELSYAELDQVGTSTLITRVTSDINQVQAGVNLFLRLFLRSPFIVVGAFVMSFSISQKLSLIFAIAIPLLALVIYGVMLLTIPLQKKVQAGLDQVLQSTRENLSGIRVVRAFRMQRQEREEFEEENRALLALQMLSGRLSALLNPVTYVIVNVATIAIVWYGGREVYAGHLTRGEVVALVNYMSQILLALVALFNLIVASTKAFASAGRVSEVLEVQSSIVSGEAKWNEDIDPAELVSFKNVSLTYGSAKEASICNISFAVKKGQFVGIIGGTGSGKSSLVNLIPRLYNVTEGCVCVAGRDVKEYDLDSLRERIGVAEQKAVLFKGTLRENMQMGNALVTDEEIYRALEIAQAKEIVEQKGEGLDLHISQNGRNLSGGQRQRFIIARALVKKPDILILDDSTSALDFATDARLRKALVEHTKQMTVFVVSQRVSSVMNADKIFVLDDGKLVGEGTHEVLRQSCEVYREICHSQLDEEVAKDA